MKKLLLIFLVGCTDPSEPELRIDACATLRAEAEPDLGIWEIQVEGDIVGQGTTRRCGDEPYLFTWADNAQVIDDQVGFIGRPRLEMWEQGVCGFFPAVQVRKAQDPKFGECP